MTTETRLTYAQRQQFIASNIAQMLYELDAPGCNYLALSPSQRRDYEEVATMACRSFDPDARKKAQDVAAFALAELMVGVGLNAHRHAERPLMARAKMLANTVITSWIHAMNGLTSSFTIDETARLVREKMRGPIEEPWRETDTPKAAAERQQHEQTMNARGFHKEEQ